MAADDRMIGGMGGVVGEGLEEIFRPDRSNIELVAGIHWGELEFFEAAKLASHPFEGGYPSEAGRHIALPLFYLSGQEG